MKYGNIPIIHQKNLIKNFNIQNRGSTNDQTKALTEKTEVPLTMYTDVSMDHRKDTTKRNRNTYKSNRCQCIRNYIMDEDEARISCVFLSNISETKSFQSNTSSPRSYKNQI